MKKKYVVVFALAMLFVLSSCTDRQKAISIAEDFIEQYAVAPEQLQDCSFGKLGTTRVLSDSIIQKLQNTKNELLKPNAAFQQHVSGTPLQFIRMNYVANGDTISHTFYFDELLQHVVAVK